MFVVVNFTKTSKQFHLISNMDHAVHSTLVPLLLYFVFTIIHGILAGGNVDLIRNLYPYRIGPKLYF